MMVELRKLHVRGPVAATSCGDRIYTHGKRVEDQQLDSAGPADVERVFRQIVHLISSFH